MLYIREGSEGAWKGLRSSVVSTSSFSLGHKAEVGVEGGEGVEIVLFLLPHAYPAQDRFKLGALRKISNVS